MNVRCVDPADFNQVSLRIELRNVNFVCFDLPLIGKSLLQFADFFAGQYAFHRSKAAIVGQNGMREMHE